MESTRNVVQHASQTLLKQIEESRARYTRELEEVRQELQGLLRQKLEVERENELAAATTSAAKHAAAEATVQLETLTQQLQGVRSELDALNRCAWRLLSAPAIRAAASRQRQTGGGG